ncbi:hypothetical protein C2845_PM01G41460 [Panicum miliaceum]|uniref:Uncharacterized protein n=1 Tax=Panicum miliaceum TaxID=4540 RepID=A0A3L6TL85_PANMI|nr:hypothetical protein C2845_PM01G41460 [Panicum miliaceum]
MEKRKRMDAEAAPRPEQQQDRGDGGGAEGRPTTSSVTKVGEQQQAAAASHPELSRPHVHGEAEDGSAALGDDLDVAVTRPADLPPMALHSATATAPGGPASTAAFSSIAASAHDVPGPSSSPAADAPSTGASSTVRRSVEVLGDDGAAAAASASPDHAAAPAAGSTAAALPPPAGVKLPYKKEKAALREKIHYYLTPEPLMLDDDSTFRQMAVAIQNIRGTEMDLANLSGADAVENGRKTAATISKLDTVGLVVLSFSHV